MAATKTLLTADEFFRLRGGEGKFVADARRQTVTVYAPGHPAQVLRGDDVLSGQDVLPGLEIRVSDLFRY